MKLLITAERLRDLFVYDPDTGELKWTVGAGSVKAGSLAGCVAWDGYVRVTIQKKPYAAHRLIWLWMTGAWPAEHIDHINGVRADNRWSNLRSATRSQNEANKPSPRTNTSGYKWVCWDKQRSKWKAIVRINGRSRSLGYFDDPERAHAVSAIKAVSHYGEYARVDSDNFGRST